MALHPVDQAITTPTRNITARTLAIPLLQSRVDQGRVAQRELTAALAELQSAKASRPPSPIVMVPTKQSAVVY
jgi:hypothetical protein